MPERKRKRPRGVIDTSVLVAGFAAFKSIDLSLTNPRAILLREWLHNDTFTWLISREILVEYKRVLSRLRTRRFLIGRLVNILRKRAASVSVSPMISISPDPGDDPFCACAEQGAADFIVTLNPKDFPQQRLSAYVIQPGDPVPTTRRSRK